MRIAFIAWNLFQVSQVAPIFEESDDEIVLLFQTDRKGADKSILSTPPKWCSTIAITRRETREIDGVFDALITQTALPEAEAFERTAIIALQYSMAKEAHQYGPWHFFADARLTYGDYSKNLLDFYGNAFSVGNPKTDVLFNNAYDFEIEAGIRSQLDPNKQTVLYAPTYGALSTIDFIAPVIPELSERFNFMITPHHNTVLREKERIDPFHAQPINADPEAILYYHKIADAVISDYSGAIFDAIVTRTPVVLFRPDGQKVIGVGNLTQDSIEVARADDIGRIVTRPEDLADALIEAIQVDAYLARNEALRRECFVNFGSAGQAAMKAIQELAAEPRRSSKTLPWTRKALTSKYKLV